MPSTTTCVVLVLVLACLVIDHSSAMPGPSKLLKGINVDNVTQDGNMDGTLEDQRIGEHRMWRRCFYSRCVCHVEERTYFC